MPGYFFVTEPAASLALLTIEELRQAAGVTGEAQDASLLAMERRAAAAIMSECMIAVSDEDEHPATLLRERITESFDATSELALVLSRRHSVEIVSVTVGGTILDAVEYRAKGATGLLYRRRAGQNIHWGHGETVVDYWAGFETVPESLRLAALETFRAIYLESNRDPTVKSLEEEVPGVGRIKTDYWVGAMPGQGSANRVPDEAKEFLSDFYNFAVSGP